MFKVDVIVRPNKDGWWAEIPSLPGCFSGGESLEELKQNIHEAIYFKALAKSLRSFSFK